MFTTAAIASLAGGVAMIMAAVATNPKAPAPGECVTYALYGKVQQKGDCQ